MSYENYFLGDLVQSISETYRFGNRKEIYFLNTSDTENGKVINHQKFFISDLPGQAKKKIAKGDLLFSEIRPANKRFALVDFDAEEYVVSTKLMVLRCSDKIDSRYFFYYLTNPQMLEYLQMLAESRSGTFPQITFDQISDIEIALPPIPIQRRIAAILTALDDKIELNRRMNETLEGIAQAVWGEWFGKYANGEEELPAGWRSDALDEIATFLNGLALQKYPPENDLEYLPVIKIREMKQGVTNATDKASVNIPPQYVVQDGNVLFSWSGSLDVGFWTQGNGALNQHLFKVTSQLFPKWFYFFWIKYHLTEFRQIAAGKATTMGHIQRKHLSSAEVLIPSPKELEIMDSRMSPIIDKLIENQLQSRTLAALRDALLPQLMQEELQV